MLPQSQTPQQKYDQCRSQFTNTAVGQASQFFSVPHIFTSLGNFFEGAVEWGIGGTAKAYALQGAKAVEQGTGVEGYSVVEGSTAEATAPWVTAATPLIAYVGATAVAAGSGADMLNAATCEQVSIGANPGIRPRVP